MRVRFLFAWFDFWIGLYWDRAARRLYVLPIPMLGFVIDLPLRTKHSDDCPRESVERGRA